MKRIVRLSFLLVFICFFASSCTDGYDDFDAAMRAYYKYNSTSARDPSGRDEDKIIKLFTKSIESGDLSRSDLILAYECRGEMWFRRKKIYDKAITDYTKIIELKPKDASAYNMRGRAWYRIGNYDKAIADYTKAIEFNPMNDAYYSNRGYAWFEKEDYDRAITDYKKAIELNPKNAEYNDTLKRAMSKKAEQVAAKKEKDATVYNKRGIAWYEKKNYDKAIADFTKAIELNPRDDVLYHNRGNAWYRKGNYDKAIANYTKAIELNPKDDDYYNMRGIAWYEKKNYDKAIADFTKAIDLNPKEGAYYHNRGDAWFNKEDYDRAIANFTKAVELDPKNTKYNDKLKRAMSKKAEQVAAKEEPVRAVSVTLEDANGREITLKIKDSDKVYLWEDQKGGNKYITVFNVKLQKTGENTYSSVDSPGATSIVRFKNYEEYYSVKNKIEDYFGAEFVSVEPKYSKDDKERNKP